MRFSGQIDDPQMQTDESRAMEMMSFLVCPGCRGDLQERPEALQCAKCNRHYPVSNGVPHFDLPATAEGDAAEGRDARRSYWDHGWEERYQKDHAHLARLQTNAEWRAFIAKEQKYLQDCRHILTTEVNREAVAGKIVVDIGCGAGTSSAHFANYGARYIGVDHSRHAAMYSLRHLRAMQGEGFTAQGNAEALPLRDASIDVVYSNGVLHHTPNFNTAMDEAYRVLKPGGRAIIALYATYSTLFGVTRLMGVARGHLSRKSMDAWMGRQTEGDWRTGDRVNLWTETFSEGALRRIVRKYNVRALRFRKNGNPVGELPRVGRALMRSGAMRALDRSLEPVLGSMVIMTYEK
jgi:SAM-dependent methyltransferase/uncharacterized protein YbaR (Trm112 family)